MKSYQVQPKPQQQLVFTINKHSHFGMVIEARVVELLENGSYSLTSSKVRAANATYFDADDTMQRAINSIENIQVESIMQLFYKGKKNIKPVDFLQKEYTLEMHTKVREYIENQLKVILPLVKNYPIFLEGENGNPTEHKLNYSEQPANVLFHFKKNEEGMNYFITIKHEEQKIDFYQNGSEILISSGAWMVTPTHLLHFSSYTDGKKIKPFLNKRFIHIANEQIPVYLEKFVKPLLENHDIYTDCFKINTDFKRAKPVLKLSLDLKNNVCPVLYFDYGGWEFPYHNNKKVNVSLEKNNDTFQLTRIKRSVSFEQKILSQLLEMGIEYTNTYFFKSVDNNISENWGLDWLNQNYEHLERLEYEIDEKPPVNKNYYVGPIQLNIQATKSTDWFDLEAIVHLNGYDIPFTYFREYIINNIQEYLLPDNKIFLIPTEWFEKLNNLSKHTEDNGKTLVLKNMHLGILNEIHSYITDRNNVEQDWTKDILNGTIPDQPLPQNFIGELRHYQQEGYNWIAYMHSHGIGPLLADDMGLGKTIQAICAILNNHQSVAKQAVVTPKGQLTHIQSTDENGLQSCKTSLIIAPKSLLYNWKYEIEKFTKDTSVLIYAGTNRKQFQSKLNNYNIIISSYGTIRSDIEYFESAFFNTIVLDESQAIKNPASQSAIKINRIKASNKLALTGTPIENTLLDIWSQMNFLNPGLLGTYVYFERNYLKPIEKKADNSKATELRNLLTPLILRRTKAQVAKELPEKIEKIHYCEMSEQQNSEYQKVLSQYRNEFLFNNNAETLLKKNKLKILNGLTHLRQLALNPLLKNSEYEGDSGKDDEILRMLLRAINSGHKILIFSQFVSYLQILKNQLEHENIMYAYLDGSMDNQSRDQQVQLFQNNENIKVFLLSLRAGNSGLNLTAADYVFLADPWWNPFTMKQAEARAHRIGQSNTVLSYKFITKDSIEEKILKLQQKKTDLAQNIIPDETTILANLSEQDLNELLA